MMAIKVQSIPDIVEIENWSNYETGIASWYGPGFHGRTTANGEKYNMYGMTAAHKKLKFGTKVRVTNLLTGKQIIVRINDRGPFVGGRVIDLSKTGMQELAGNSGLCKVKLEIIK
jgi:rare lipoprotein A